MPSSTVVVLQSIRRWMLSIAFLLGLGVVALAATGYGVTGTQEGTLFAVVGVSGGVIALLAVLALFWGSLPRVRILLISPETQTKV